MGKETVLALLLREKGHFVSGEAVSAELGITRAAIWKSISALRAQGYEIDAVTGRGYCLKSLPDTLTEQTVRSYLGPVETVGKRIDCFDSIDSTNAYLKRIALDGAPDGTVAVAHGIERHPAGAGGEAHLVHGVLDGEGRLPVDLAASEACAVAADAAHGSHRRCDEPRGLPRGGDALADQVDKRSHPERQKALRHFDRAERRG